MSKAVRIVVDSGADLTQEVAQQYGISIVPLKVTIGDTEYQDGVNLQKEEFLDKLPHTSVMPFTTQPSPADFMQQYEQLRDDGASHIISIHLSSKMSGTFQSASLAARQVEGVQVTTVDSYSASLGIGLLAIQAAQLADAGESAEHIVAKLEQWKEKLVVYFSVDTLEYLQKNGRIGRAQALLGGMLNIKPVLTVEAGEVAAVAKARGKRKALNLVLEHVQRAIAGQTAEAAVIHAAAPEAAETLREQILAMAPGSRVSTYLLGPTIATHTGPGTLGVIALAP